MRKADVDREALRACVERIFPSGECTIERTAEGASTQVYRVRRGTEIFYLRVAEERADSLAPEVEVHQMLRARGVCVPAVVYYEPFDQRLERSIMVTTEIRGEPLSRCPDAEVARAIMRAAGRDLAVINRVPVAGFGWITRDHGTPTGPVAEHPTNRQFLLEYLDRDLTFLAEQALSQAAVTAIRAVITADDHWLDAEHAWLAHGDFDLTHVYHHDGHYTGMIDFGEIRGTAPLYDLGHFKLHDGELLSSTLLPSLLAGYQEVTTLPPGYEQGIRLHSLLIGIRTLARVLPRGASDYARYLLWSVRGIAEGAAPFWGMLY